MLLGTQAQYQWSCSSLDTANNRHLLPDLGIRDDRDVANIALRLITSSTDVHIFPLPPSLNCSGTVSAVQYCYEGDNLGTEQSIFTLLILQQSGTTFNITNTVLVRSTPSNPICTSQFRRLTYCCDVLTLDVADQFSLPTTGFAFGTIASRENLFLAFNPSSVVNSNLLVNHYRLNENNFDTTEGSMFTVTSDLMDDRTSRLLQFFISKSIPIASTHRWRKMILSMGGQHYACSSHDNRKALQ